MQDLASSVVSDLHGGGHAPPFVTTGSPGDLELVAARVLGADLLLPSLLRRAPLTEDRLALVNATLAAFPPRPQAAPTVLWSHWALAHASRLAGRPGDGPAEPGTAWIDGVTWPFLTHQLAVLAPLALPALDCTVARVARRRTLDLARGFVRAVRRRDWQQAAGAGRWLALSDQVPETLGLDAGLDFVELMGGGDSRVTLQVRAARLVATGALV